MKYWSIMQPAKIICIEGPDRVGKLTQTAMLAKHINDTRQCLVDVVEVPIKSPVTYRLIYWMLENGLAKKYPNVFQLIQFFNKLFFQVFKLPLMRWSNDYIIFDRWALSAIIYGGASQTNAQFNSWLYDRLREPDVTIILLGSPRTVNTGDEDAFESDNAFQKEVRRRYEQWGKNHCQTIVITNEGTRLEVHERIINELADRDVI